MISADKFFLFKDHRFFQYCIHSLEGQSRNLRMGFPEGGDLSQIIPVRVISMAKSPSAMPTCR